MTPYVRYVGGGNVIDFTVICIARLALRQRKLADRLAYLRVLDDYSKGTLEVAWHDGKPVPRRVQRDAA